MEGGEPREGLTRAPPRLARHCRLGSPLWRIRFPLLNSPERCRQGEGGGAFAAPETPPKRPKRRPGRGRLGRSLGEASPTRRYPRWLFGRCGDPPVTHRAQPAARTGCSRAPAGFFTDGPPWAAAGAGGFAVVVLAAIVSTPADRRAPRKSGD